MIFEREIKVIQRVTGTDFPTICGQRIKNTVVPKNTQHAFKIVIIKSFFFYLIPRLMVEVRHGPLVLALGNCVVRHSMHRKNYAFKGYRYNQCCGSKYM